MQNSMPQLSSSESETCLRSRAAVKLDLADRLQYDQETVLRRLQVDEVSDKFCVSCFLSIRNNETLWGHFQRLESLVEAGASDWRWNEHLMYDPLCAILNHIATYEVPAESTNTDNRGGTSLSFENIRTYQVDPDVDSSSTHQSLDISRTYPHISLMSSARDFGAAEDGTITDQRRLVRTPIAFVEVTVLREQGQTSPDGETVGELVYKAVDHARAHMSATPFQLLSTALLVYGLSFRVALFDRAGITFSPERSLDSPDGWHRFIRIVRCMAVTASLQQLGLDPNAVPVSPSLEAVTMVQQTAQQLKVTPPDQSPIFTISLGGQGTQHWMTVAPLYSSSSLIGSGTTVWLVQELKGDLPLGKVAIMKTAWRNPTRTPESTMYRALVKTGGHHPCVAEFLDGDDVHFPRPGFPLISVSALRGSSAAEVLDDPILHRLSLASVGRPIWMYDTEEQLILALIAAIRGYQFLRKKGILHGDVSAGNVLLSSSSIRGQEGFVTDLDYAHLDKSFFPDGIVADDLPIAGTYEFMSYRKLWAAYLENPVPHEYRDDLESFFWVFCYALQRQALHSCRDPRLIEGFRRSFGHLTLDDLCTSRSALDPAKSVGKLGGKGVSKALAQWFREARFMVSGSQFDNMVEGFNFNDENIVAMFDDALEVVRRDS